MKECRCLRQPEPVGDPDHLVPLRDGLLGVPVGLTGAGDDAPGDPAGVHALPDRDDLAGDPGARHVRRVDREALAAPRRPELRIEGQGVRDGDIDHDLPGSGERIRQHGGDERLRPRSALPG